MIELPVIYVMYQDLLSRPDLERVESCWWVGLLQGSIGELGIFRLALNTFITSVGSDDTGTEDTSLYLIDTKSATRVLDLQWRSTDRLRPSKSESGLFLSISWHPKPRQRVLCIHCDLIPDKHSKGSGGAGQIRRSFLSSFVERP